MIVCICNNVTSKQIEQLIDEGLTPKEILVKLDIGSECKTCLEFFVSEYKKPKSSGDSI